jgi:integrase
MQSESTVKVVYRADRECFYVRWIDPESGRERQRSCKTKERREALRIAGEVRADLREGRSLKTFRITWEDFRRRLELEKLSSLSQRSDEATRTALNRLEVVASPRRLADVNAAMLSRFQKSLRENGLREPTIACYLRHIKAALNWAVKMGLLAALPGIEMPKRSKGVTKDMRCRPITEEECERMIMATPKVRRLDAEKWQRFLRGLWLSGLRISEALELSWDEDAAVRVDMMGAYPMLRFLAEGEKGHQDRVHVLTPDFGQFLLDVATSDRHGLVFRIEGSERGRPLSLKRAIRGVSAIGRAAGVIVDKGSGKYASAHDFRRAFATRWARKLMPAQLQTLMRHKSMETTLRYYVSLDAEKEAAELWKSYGCPNGCPDVNKETKTAEGRGFEPPTPFGAPDFESGRWPIRLPSSAVVKSVSAAAATDNDAVVRPILRRLATENSRVETRAEKVSGGRLCRGLASRQF